jgi:hypothetical protein
MLMLVFGWLDSLWAVAMDTSTHPVPNVIIRGVLGGIGEKHISLYKF